MRVRSFPISVFLVLGFVGCSSDDSAVDAADAATVDGGLAQADAPGDSAAVDAGDADALVVDAADGDAASACVLEQSSTLPRVRFEFRSASCTFTLAQAAAGITIAYDLIVDQDVLGFTPAQNYAYGPTDGAGNLALDEKVTGAGQSYCVCDKGLGVARCADGTIETQGPGCTPVTLHAATYHRTFTWDGRNWDGPSDTSNPKGAAFPAGDYQFTVSTEAGSLGDAGPATLAATGRFAIHLTR